MQIIDSHCHIDRVDLDAFGGSVDTLLAHAKEFSVNKFLCVCINLENFQNVYDLALKYENIYASFGLHPTETNCQEPSIEDLINNANKNKVIAIGETGLDYFHVEKANANWQRERFRKHIKAANITKKPLIIHTRNAIDDTIKIMQEEKAEKGVMHCFCENWDSAKKALDIGFYISFSGILTFNNAKDLQEVAKKVPLDRILVETDAPYLTPMPHRGKPNSPAFTYFVAEKLAKIKNTSVEDIAAITTQNFNTLFHNDKS